MEHSSRSLRVVYAIVFVDMLGFGMCMPILPFLLPDAAWNGALIASYSLTQAFGNVFWGWMADRIGRRPVLLGSIAGSTISYLGFGLAVQFVSAGTVRSYLLMLSRLLGGLFGGTFSVGSAYMADVTEPHERSNGQARLGGVMGLGFIFGPPFGGLLADCGVPTNQLAFYVAAAIAGATTVAGVLCLKESLHSLRDDARGVALRADVNSPQETQEAMPRAHNDKLWSLYLAIWMSSAVIFLHFFCLAFVETDFAYLIKDYLGWGARMYAYVFTTMGVTIALSQLFVTKRMVGCFGEVWVIVLGLSLRAVAFFLCTFEPFARNGAFIFLGANCIGLGGSLANPCVSALITKIADELCGSSSSPEYGKYLGRKDAAGSLARMVAPLLGGMLYDSLGLKMMLLGAGLTLLGVFSAAALFLLIPKRLRQVPARAAQPQ